MATMSLPARTGGLQRADVHRYRYLIAFAVALASVLELVDTSIVNVAIPHMMGELGATLDEIAWVSTGYIVANVIVLPLTSWLSARFGRRNYYTGSIIVFTIASFLCGNASSLEMLVGGRVIQGIGGGALISTAQAILFDVFPVEERAAGQAIFGMSVMVGPTLGPTLGGWITDNYSWPWIFYINLPLGVLAGFLTWRLVPEPAHEAEHETETVDWWGLAFLILGVGALQVMLERGESKDWFESREIVVEGILAAIGVVSFIWHELRTDHPMVDLRILRNRQLAVGVTFAVLLGFALYSSVFALPVFLQNVLQYTAWDTGKVILPGAISSAIAMAIVGRIASKVDARLLITTGVLMFLGSMWMHYHFTIETGLSDMFWPMVLRGFGIGLVFVPLTSATVADLTPGQIPQGTGLFNLSRQLGGSFGIAVTATLLSRFTDRARSALSAHLTASDTATRGWLDAVTRSMQHLGGSLAQAQLKASALLELRLNQQASVFAFEKVFLVMGLSFTAVLPLLLLLRTGRARGGGMAH